METLSPENMMKNHRLAKHIADASWGSFKSMIEYKCSWYGKHFVQIGRFEPSSKLCSSCGWHYKDLKLSERSWTCLCCGASHDRDVNAATNIKNFGWLTLEKHLGVMDVAPRINKALLSGSPTGESIEAGKALRSQKVVSQ